MVLSASSWCYWALSESTKVAQPLRQSAWSFQRKRSSPPDHPGAPACGCRASPPLRGGECAGFKMNLASINIATILPVLVLSVFGIAVMVLEPFLDERSRSNLGWLAFAG